MSFDPPPPRAAWVHRGGRSGFEVTSIEPGPAGHRLVGTTTAVEDGGAWVVGYDIRVDERWVTRSARVTGGRGSTHRSIDLSADGAGRWWVDDQERPHLRGCLDVDLESSAVTNLLTVRRLALATGVSASAPAAFVRSGDLTVERLEQQYTRAEDRDGCLRYDYTAPAFDVATRLECDAAGLVMVYPGVAVRHL